MKKVLLWLLVLFVALILVGCDQLSGGEETSEKRVFVGPTKVDCEGEGPQTCNLIKEDPYDEWSLWYDEIEGFDFEPGYEYELIVVENQVENPPVGGSSISWSLVEIVAKKPATDDAVSETPGESETTESESDVQDEGSEEAPAVAEFVPIVVEEMGVTTVAPANWPKIEGDPLLKDAWGPGQYRFVAFHSVPGEDVQAAMAQLLGTSVEALDAGTIDGRYWTEAIGEKQWEMYEIDNPDVGLVQTVSMLGEQGNIYVVSLFIETAQKDSVLASVLENFVVAGEESAAESEDSEEVDDAGTETAAEESGDEASTVLLNSSWTLIARDDGSGQRADVLPDVEVTAVFTAEGRMSGSAGCNDYSTVYAAEEDKITISIPAKTRKECADPAGIMAQETSYLSDLTEVASYLIDAEELQLLDSEGNVIMVFSPF